MCFLISIVDCDKEYEVGLADGAPGAVMLEAQTWRKYHWLIMLNHDLRVYIYISIPMCVYVLEYCIDGINNMESKQADTIRDFLIASLL